jgi:hypothetical protein
MAVFVLGLVCPAAAADHPRHRGAQRCRRQESEAMHWLSTGCRR